jgi:uncharacterized protein (TIGR03435 family)
MLKSRLLGAVGIVAVLGGVLVAQTPASPAFEIASVKRNNSGDTRISVGLQPGGRFVAVNVTAHQLIQYANDLQKFQVVGGPVWLDVERFDVMAKATDETSASQIRLMTRTLLADRFSVATHAEIREAPTYALILDRVDGRFGPQLTKASGDCQTQGTCGPHTGGNATVRLSVAEG